VSEKKPVLRDVDSAGRAQKLHALGWSMIGGVVIAMLGYFWAGPLGFILGWPIGTLIVWAIAVGFAERAGAAASTIYMSSGSSTPMPKQYSQGDALAQQGKFPAAIREYEQNAADNPTDPEPCIRLARLHRDRLQQYDEAARWFRHVLQLPALPATAHGAIAREVVELYTHRMKQPAKALPILARLAEQQPDTPAGTWARTELRELKQSQNAKSNDQ
jgi:tetratricopeptide (TPR) repeat protein